MISSVLCILSPFVYTNIDYKLFIDEDEDVDVK